MRINRREFNAGMLAALVVGVGSKAPDWREIYDPNDRLVTQYDPEDPARDPMLVRPLPVRVTDSSVELHMLPAAPAEVKVIYGATGSSKRDSEKFNIIDFTPLLVPLGVERNGSLDWTVQWRARGARKWKDAVSATTRALPRQKGATKIAVIGDTHCTIEGLDEVHAGGVFKYRVNKGYMGKLFKLLRAEEPDIVIFSGDDAGVDARYMWEQKKFRALPDYDYKRRAFLLWRLWRQLLAEELGGLYAVQVIGNHEAAAGFDSRDRPWSTVAKKCLFPQPLPSTYPLGGENERFRPADASAAALGYRSPLENYFGVRVGDVDVLVLDVMGYSGTRRGEPPTSPKHWSYGRDQLKWMRDALAEDSHWKLLVTHHLAGGARYGPQGERGWVAYGRGGARYADVGEQALVHRYMMRAVENGAAVIHAGAHDHNWWHALVDGSFGLGYTDQDDAYRSADGVVYMGNGSPSHFPDWALKEFHDKMYREEDVVAKGFVVIEATRAGADIRYVRCGKPRKRFDGTRQRELRAPKVSPGENLDRFFIKRS